MSDVAPIRREVVVELEPQAAFELFTDRIGAWWPVAEFSVFGAEASVAFAGGEIVETLGERTSVWGTVLDWSPGERVSFTWHPGGSAERASSVSVTFASHGADQTLVTLEHSGWEVFDDPVGARENYDQGWPMVLDRYRRSPDHGSGEMVASS